MINKKGILGACIGGTLGFLISYLYKCSSGTCMITGNYFIMPLLGASVGVNIASYFDKK